VVFLINIDEDFLKKNYLTMTNKEMANHFNVNINQIKRGLEKLFLRRAEFEYIPFKNEELKDIHLSFGNYGVTNLGRVVNRNRFTILKPQIKNQYHQVGLSENKIMKWISVHRLVAFAFITNDNPIEKTQVNHIDGNKLNNVVENLEWVTPLENQLHALRTGLKIPVRGSQSGTAKLSEKQAVEICELLSKGNRVCDIVRMKEYATKSIVEKIKNKKRWGHITKDYNF
jgi:transposase